MRGLRLTKPPNVSDGLYQLMLDCWQTDLDERPTFEEILQVLQDMEAVRVHCISYCTCSKEKCAILLSSRSPSSTIP